MRLAVTLQYANRPTLDALVEAQSDPSSPLYGHWLSNAQFNTPESQIIVSGAMDHLVSSRTSAHLNAKVALDEIGRTAGLTTSLNLAHAPRFLMADITASMDADTILRTGRLTSRTMLLTKLSLIA